MANIAELYPSKFLKCPDLKGNEVRVAIAGVKIVDSFGSRKIQLAFKAKAGEKFLTLGKTNAKTLAAAFGPETDGWSGKSITLFPTKTTFQGRQVDTIGVRAAPQNDEGA